MDVSTMNDAAPMIGFGLGWYLCYAKSTGNASVVLHHVRDEGELRSWCGLRVSGAFEAGGVGASRSHRACLRCRGAEPTG
jgi:hypothetical protein